jgi:hypothetical protein
MSSLPFLHLNHARHRPLRCPRRQGLPAVFLIVLLHAKLISVQVFLRSTVDQGHVSWLDRRLDQF